VQLSAAQQERVNELLQRRGEKCPQCGSTALASTGVAYRTANHRISVQYACTNRNAEHPDPTGFGPWSVPLELHEAQEIARG
jgi:hypothetical protein